MLWMILSWWTHLYQTIKCTTLSMNLIATMDFGWCFVIFKWIPEVISHCKSLNDESIKGNQHQYVIDIGFSRMLSSLLGSPKSSEQCLVPKHTALCSQPALPCNLLRVGLGKTGPHMCRCREKALCQEEGRATGLWAGHSAVTVATLPNYC